MSDLTLIRIGLDVPMYYKSEVDEVISDLHRQLEAEREKHDEEAYNDMAAACEVLRKERDETRIALNVEEELRQRAESRLKDFPSITLVNSLRAEVATLRAEREHMARKSEDVAAYEAWQLAEKRAVLWEQRARQTLWLNHGCDGLYGDDGEMQCGNVSRHPGVWDFKRTAWEDIETGFVRALTAAEAARRGDRPSSHIQSADCFAKHPTIAGLMCGLKKGHDGPHHCDVHHEEWE